MSTTAASSQPVHATTDAIGHPNQTKNGPLNFEHRSGQGAGEDGEPKHSSQHVCAGPGDEQGGQYLHGEHEAKREEVAQQIWQAEGGRLPVKGQRHSQCAVGIPQRQMTLVDLRPSQGGPRDHLVDLVAGKPVVDLHPVLLQDAVVGEPVVFAQ